MRELDFCSTQFMSHPVCLSMLTGDQIYVANVDLKKQFMFHQSILYLYKESTPDEGDT